MIAMLCRNRVSDYLTWKRVFSSHAQAHREAGLHLRNLWRGLEEPNNVFFMFEVSSLEKARKFVSNPEAAKAAEQSGVVDAEYHFVEDAGGY